MPEFLQQEGTFLPPILLSRKFFPCGVRKYFTNDGRKNNEMFLKLLKLDPWRYDLKASGTSPTLVF
jgi:hypothetical protein